MKNSILTLVAFLTFTISLSATNTIPSPINTTNNINPIHNALADEQASFSHEDLNLKTWVEQQIVYPELARQYAVEGRVVVEFVITENGKAEQFKVIKSLGLGCDKAAIATLKQMPQWNAAKKEGKKIPVKLAVAIDFSLR